VIAGLAFVYAMGWHRYFTLEYLSDSREWLMVLTMQNPILAPLVFFVIYAVAVAFAFPAASVLTIFGGFLFGCALGSVLVTFAATIGATILFLAARSAFGGFLHSRVHGRLARFSEGFEENAFSYLLALRLAPVVPFFVLNVAPAFFEVKLKTFVAATFLGILPGVVAYSYLGQGVDSVLVAAEEAGRQATLADLVTPQITVAFAALALVAILAAVVRTLRGHG
jgi:uncharacterized membrane protein YdjX (TVP38/TMEM64 family)